MTIGLQVTLLSADVNAAVVATGQLAADAVDGAQVSSAPLRAITPTARLTPDLKFRA
jgi:hypothetical protein